MKEGLVSIIMPAYNAERFIGKTIDSVLTQQYTNWELIVVNDGSKDSTKNILEKFHKEDERIKPITQKNAGSAAARNRALSEAQGQYISFLDADDLWDSDFLEKQIKFIKESNTPLVFSSYRRVNENGIQILKPFIVPSKVTYKELLKTCSISCLTALYDRGIIGEQRFRPELKSLRDDFAFWLNILKKIDFAKGNPDILASYRVFSNSTTGNKKKVVKPQFLIYYKVEKLGLIRSVYYLMNWAIRGFLKYRK